MNSLVFNQDFTLNAGNPITFLNQFLFSVNDLHINDGIIYKVIRASKTPNKEINTYINPGMNGVNYMSDYARGGVITLDMYVQGRNSEEFMENLYKLKSEINKKNVFLRVVINNKIEQGLVVAEGEPTVFEHYNTYWIPIQLQFNYFYFLNNSNYTGLSYRVDNTNYRKSIFYKGYAPTFPNITLIFYKNISYLKILNELNEDYIEINENFSENDILFINFSEAKIYKNNQEVLIDFDGKFFEIENGENIFNITNNGSGSGDYFNVIVQYTENIY